MRKKKSDYEKSLEDITGSEKNDRPTDASIRKAIIAARSDMGPDKATTGTGIAARNYLAERGEQISDSRYKKVEAQVVQEEQAKNMKALIGPLASAIGKEVTDAIDRARAPVVKIDGNPVAKAVDNASDRKRKP